MSDGSGGDRTRFGGVAVGAAALLFVFGGLFAVMAATGTPGDPRPLGVAAFGLMMGFLIGRRVSRRARVAHGAPDICLVPAGLGESGSQWQEATFTRGGSAWVDRTVDRCNVDCERIGREVRFVALQLDDAGKRIRLAASPTFPVRRGAPVRPTNEFRAMHNALVTYLLRHGWEIDEPAGDDCWFAASLRRVRA
jgi:hypothetical protein